MIYLTGDTHGDLSCFKNPKLNKLGEKDYLIVCGDFGFLWDSESEEEKKKLEQLKKKKYTICFVDGVHENFDIINSYQPYRWKGGNAHKIADNIFHLMRGEIFTFEGKTFFAMGGGESDDADSHGAFGSRFASVGHTDQPDRGCASCQLRFGSTCGQSDVHQRLQPIRELGEG